MSNRSRDQIAQANTYTQRHMNDVRNKIVVPTPCLALNYTFPPQFIQWIWDIPTPISHKLYGLIQTLFFLITLIITIMRLRATYCCIFNTIYSSNSNTPTFQVVKVFQFQSSKKWLCSLHCKCHVFKWHRNIQFQRGIIMYFIVFFSPCWGNVVLPPISKHLTHPCKISSLS